MNTTQPATIVGESTFLKMGRRISRRDDLLGNLEYKKVLSRTRQVP